MHHSFCASNFLQTSKQQLFSACFWRQRAGYLPQTWQMRPQSSLNCRGRACFVRLGSCVSFCMLWRFCRIPADIAIDLTSHMPPYAFDMTISKM